MLSRTEIFTMKSESWIRFLYLYNKSRFKNTTGIGTSKFAKKVDLTHLKSNVDKLDIDKLVPVPVDLSKLSDIVKKDDYNTKIKNIEDKITDITN